MGIFEDRLEAGYLTARQLLEATHCQHLYDLIRRGEILAPSHRSEGSTKVYYSADEVRQLIKSIKKRMAKVPTMNTRRHEAKMYSISEVAKKCKVTPITIHWHIDKGRIPAPKHSFAKCSGLFYNQNEFEDVCYKYQTKCRKWYPREK